MNIGSHAGNLILRTGILAASLAAGSMWAQSATSTNTSSRENPEEFSRVRGLFDVDLPKTVEKYQLRLIVHPHFGDLLHRDYLRVPVGVRAGLSQRTEVNGEVESYFSHGLKNSGAGYGVSVLRSGIKYEWGDWLKSIVDTSVGLNVSAPVSHPPIDLTDGYGHVSPYLTFSKNLPDRPKLTPFVSLGTDVMWKTEVAGSFAKNQPHSDSMGISAGYLYDVNDKFKYTLTCRYTTTALIGEGSKHYVSINPSVLWQLPPVLKFHSKGAWLFGIGFNATFGPDGNTVTSSGKLRGEFKFSRLWRKQSGAAKP